MSRPPVVRERAGLVERHVHDDRVLGDLEKHGERVDKTLFDAIQSV